MRITLNEVIRILSMDDITKIMDEIQDFGVPLYTVEGKNRSIVEVIIDLLKKVEETEELNKEEEKENKELKGYMFKNQWIKV